MSQGFLQQVQNHSLHWSCTNLYPREWKLVAPVHFFSACARSGQINSVLYSDDDDFFNPYVRRRFSLKTTCFAKIQSKLQPEFSSPGSEMLHAISSECFVARTASLFCQILFSSYGYLSMVPSFHNCQSHFISLIFMGALQISG